ncbi:MAG: hypothetical protein RQM90_14515 [Methanoculleus sp.]
MIWTVVTVLTGFAPGIVAYILVWIILPQGGEGAPH